LWAQVSLVNGFQALCIHRSGRVNAFTDKTKAIVGRFASVDRSLVFLAESVQANQCTLSTCDLLMNAFENISWLAEWSSLTESSIGNAIVASVQWC